MGRYFFVWRVLGTAQKDSARCIQKTALFVLISEDRAPVDYCFRYRSRYERLMKRFCDLASPDSHRDVLDIGGGQLALLCKKLWNDRALRS